MIFLVSFLIVLLLVASYVIYNMYAKYSRLESVAIENQEFILAIRKRVMSQRSYLKQIDRAGSFESDDEVGFFFKELKKIINDISLYLEDEVEDEDEDQKNNIVSKLTRM